MKRKASSSSGPKPPKKQRKNNYNTFRRMNNRVMDTIPNQSHTFRNIMQQYYRENPSVLYRYQRVPFEIPTRRSINAMSRIHITQQRLKRKINGPGKTKNNPILLYSISSS